MTERRGALSVLGVATLLLSLLASARADAPPPTLDVLLARFAALPGLSARFREEKHIALLAAPLVNEGTLYFAPPGRLVRHTERPARSTLLLSEGRLTVGEAGRVRTLEVSENPAIRVFVEGFVHLLSGDRARLEADFALDFAVEPGGAWRLRMRPRDARVLRMVRAIEARGRDVELASLDIEEASSDRTHMTFHDVDAGRRFTEAELARLFRVASP